MCLELSLSVLSPDIEAQMILFRRTALGHAAEAQERADLAELKAYQDNLATQVQRKALSGEVAKRDVRRSCNPSGNTVVLGAYLHDLLFLYT